MRKNSTILYGKNLEVLEVTAGGTHSYHSALHFNYKKFHCQIFTFPTLYNRLAESDDKLTVNNSNN
jgi:hypothetical protein